MEYTLELTGDRKVGERFDKFPDLAREGIYRRISALTGRLASMIEAMVPRGKTGALAAAVRSGVENQPNRVRGFVSLAGGNVKTVILPAVALEYGSHTNAAVQAYRRNIDSVFGRLVEPTSQVVSAYRRATNIDAVRFIRGPTQSIGADAIAQIREAIAEAEANSK